MSQMKRQDTITARELNDTEVSDMPHREVNEMVIKIIIGLQKRVEALNKERPSTKSYKT